MDELGEIVCAEEWLHAKDVAYLQSALYEQMGATSFLNAAVAGEPEAQNPNPKEGTSGSGKTRKKGH